MLYGLIAAVGAAALWGWQRVRPNGLPEGFAASNGRIEAVEIDIATKTPGRLDEILVSEGDFVRAGETLARMDVKVLEANLREAEARLQQAKTTVESTGSNVTRRESEMAAAQSVVEQRIAERDLAQRRFDRAATLRESNALSNEEFDTKTAELASSQAGVSRAQADVAAAEAGIAAAKSDVFAAEASVIAAEAVVERLKVDIDDSILRSPRDGRIQYLVARAGEVLSAGGRVLNLLDVSDVYMTFFLPTSEAGRIGIGSEARLVLDAAPQYVIPAKITFVADVAQFTPKTVETEEERQKLMFRIKARVSPEVLTQYIQQVKTGLPGMVYVQMDPEAAWPERLAVRLPE